MITALCELCVTNGELEVMGVCVSVKQWVAVSST